MFPMDPRYIVSVPKYNPTRTWTAEGTLGLGGPCFAIYPVESPGGYQLLGRTLRIFDLERRNEGFGDSPFLLRPGDRVSFYQVEEDELLADWEKIEAGEYTYDIEDSPFDVGAYLEWLPKVADDAAERRRTAEAACGFDAGSLGSGADARRLEESNRGSRGRDRDDGPGLPRPRRNDEPGLVPRGADGPPRLPRREPAGRQCGGDRGARSDARRARTSLRSRRDDGGLRRRGRASRSTASPSRSGRASGLAGGRAPDRDLPGSRVSAVRRPSPEASTCRSSSARAPPTRWARWAATRAGRFKRAIGSRSATPGSPAPPSGSRKRCVPRTRGTGTSRRCAGRRPLRTT